MALLILALLQRIFLMSSLMLLLVWLIFFMVLIKLLPILGTISGKRSEERFSRNAETDLVCRLLLEKKTKIIFLFLFFFCCNHTSSTDIYSLSLHDALPIFSSSANAESAVWLFSYWRYCKGYF